MPRTCKFVSESWPDRPPAFPLAPDIALSMLQSYGGVIVLRRRQSTVDAGAVGSGSSGWPAAICAGSPPVRPALWSSRPPRHALDFRRTVGATTSPILEGTSCRTVDRSRGKLNWESSAFETSSPYADDVVERHSAVRAIRPSARLRSRTGGHEMFKGLVDRRGRFPGAKASTRATNGFDAAGRQLVESPQP